MDYNSIHRLTGSGEPVEDIGVARQVEIQIKYSGYIERQQEEITRHIKHEARAIPAALEYESIKGLSTEVRLKLQDHRPETIGQAGRIAGVTPAAISLLLIYLKKREYSERKHAG